MFLPPELALIKDPPASVLTNQSYSVLTNQDSAFWTHHTSRIRSPHLNENGPIRGQRQHSVYIHQLPLGSGSVHFPFPPRIENCVSPAGAETPKKPQQTRADRRVWNRAEQLTEAGEAQQSRATLPQGNLTVLFHSQAISQLSCFHWMKFPSLPHPKSEIPVGIELVSMTIS